MSAKKTTEADDAVEKNEELAPPDQTVDLVGTTAVKKAQATKGRKSRQTKPKLIRIVLDENDDIPPTGLFVGLNGRGYLIRPGCEVDIHPDVLEVLDNAVQSRPVVSPENKQVIGYRNQKRYSYTIVR